MMLQAAPSVGSVKVDLSGAGATTLERELSGVGEAKARAIVAYRESNGPVASVGELLGGKGIGKATAGHDIKEAIRQSWSSSLKAVSRLHVLPATASTCPSSNHLAPKIYPRSSGG